MRTTERRREPGAGPEIDRGSEATDHLTGIRVPFDGALVYPMLERGERGQLRRVGWYAERATKDVAPTATAGEIKRHLRSVVAAMTPETRAGLRYELLRRRGYGAGYIAKLMQQTDPAIPAERWPELVRAAGEIVSASLSRHFGYIPRFRPSWVGRI